MNKRGDFPIKNAEFGGHFYCHSDKGGISKIPTCNKQKSLRCLVHRHDSIRKLRSSITEDEVCDATKADSSNEAD